MALIPLINILLLHKNPLCSFPDRHFQRDDCVTHAKTKRLFTRCSRPRCCHCKKWKYLVEGKAVIDSVCWYRLVTFCAQSSACQFSACLPIMSASLSLDSSQSFLFIPPTGSRLVRACPLINCMLAFPFACLHLLL